MSVTIGAEVWAMEPAVWSGTIDLPTACPATRAGPVGVAEQGSLDKASSFRSSVPGQQDPVSLDKLLISGQFQRWRSFSEGRCSQKSREVYTLHRTNGIF